MSINRMQRTALRAAAACWALAGRGSSVVPETSKQFVADGRERWMRTEEYRHLARQTEDRVRRQLAPALATAGPLKRLWLELQMARELRRELAKLAPEEANWLAAPTQAMAPGPAFPLGQRVRVSDRCGRRSELAGKVGTVVEPPDAVRGAWPSYFRTESTEAAIRRIYWVEFQLQRAEPGAVDGAEVDETDLHRA